MNRFWYYAPLLWFISCGSSGDERIDDGALENAGAEDSVLVPKPDYCNAEVKTGAECTDGYFDKLSNKRVAVVANPTSRVGSVHLVDSLQSAGFDIVRVFSPEHGFRGTADAGEEVKDGTDRRTGLPVVSLYGDNKRPSMEQLSDVDVLIFDIQDVGARFYTYISTLTYVLDAAGEAGIEMIILDRPNPNGHYVDGPVLDLEFSSFVGMHEIPVVHGMTIGEYASMIEGEKWNKFQLGEKLQIIKCEGWDHSLFYEIPVAPSPNLSTMKAIYLYPSLCIFEGTIVSVGRGTDKPFQQIGHPKFIPDSSKSPTSFIPMPNAGAGNPLLKGQQCRGYSFENWSLDSLRSAGFEISWLIEFYEQLKSEPAFFQKSGFIHNLAGTDEFKRQIESGVSQPEIEAGWVAGLTKFKAVRKKYLLYADFE